jgi:hypothetical protein
MPSPTTGTRQPRREGHVVVVVGFVAQPRGNGGSSLSAVSACINRSRSGRSTQRAGASMTTVVTQGQQVRSRSTGQLHQLRPPPCDNGTSHGRRHVTPRLCRCLWPAGRE